MKTSIRSKRFTIGMVLFLGIILLLSISSAYYLNRLSNKTKAILKENHYSVVYAQDMSDNLTNINQEIINCFLTNIFSDTMVVNKELMLFNKSLELEKNNITETGESKLVSGIETNYHEYCDSVIKVIKSPKKVGEILALQKRYDTLNHQLLLLSRMNEKAIEEKTNDAKVYSKKATFQMTFIGTLCFLIAYGFTFILSSYFNERFYKLYTGIKETGSGHYIQRIYLEGNDELSEIAEVFNKMTETLINDKQKISLTLPLDKVLDNTPKDILELKKVLLQIKNIEEQANKLISKLENK